MTESKGNNSKSINARVMSSILFLCSAHPLMLIDIYMNLREDSLNSFQVIARTGFCEREQGEKTLYL